MAKLTKKQIQQLAIQIVTQSPQGIRFSELLKQIALQHPETPVNTISGATYNLAALFPQQITKPSKGLYISTSANGITPPAATVAKPSTTAVPTLQLQEQQFYQPFADFVTGELSEAVVAEPLGGAGLGRKWGTPDVVGVYKPLASDRIKFELEIVSAEIKIDPQESVTAFGQAVAYRLFSTKVYVVMPNTLPKDDQNRLEALCMLFGVGLVIFDLNPTSPNFVTRIRAQRFTPDMFYVNVFADQLYKHNLTLFQKLF